MSRGQIQIAFFVVTWALLVTSSSALARTQTTGGLTAEYGGHAIALEVVANYHCHDSSYPAIRCFDSPADRDSDQAAAVNASATSGTDGPEPIPGASYVTWFAAANYGGSSFTASSSYADLASIGWNNSISSFKSLNGGRPKWWQSTNFAGTSWQWAAGAQVSYVGDAANDQFTSVANVP